MLQAGLSQRHVATELGVSQSVVSRAWNRFRQYGTVDRRYGGGRERATTPAQDRFIVLSALRNRNSTASVLQRDLQQATGVRVSTQTVRNRLHSAGLRSRRPVVRVPLLRRHHEHRLDWTGQHLRWTNQDWSNVLFTDESRFCVDFQDGRVHVWRALENVFQTLMLLNISGM